LNGQRKEEEAMATSMVFLSDLKRYVAGRLGIPFESVDTKEDHDAATVYVMVPDSVPQVRADEVWEDARQMLPWGVALSVMPRKATQTEKPKPAAGQVWRDPRERGAEFTITKTGSTASPVFDIEGVSSGRPDAIHSAGLVAHWQCIGIETTAGRVMVGEYRRPHDGVAYKVEAIEADSCVAIRAPSGQSFGDVPALEVARWPLVGGPLATAAKDAVREHGRMTIGGVDVPVTSWTREPVTGAGDTLIGKTAGRAEFSVDFTLTPEEYAKLCGIVFGKPATKPDPRAERERRRRDIDAVLREDARRFPEFATARKCAVLGFFEDAEMNDRAADWTRGILTKLRIYEEHRGGMREPSPKAIAVYGTGYLDGVRATYERTRHL